MFWFHHPKPFSQRAVAVQIVQRKAAAARDTSVIIVEKDTVAMADARGSGLKLDPGNSGE